MFQKSCLFKCIQSSKLNESDANIFEYKASLDTSARKNLLPHKQWSTLKQRINNSIGKKKIIRNKIKLKKNVLKKHCVDTFNYEESNTEDDDDDSDASFSSFYRTINDDLNSSMSSVSSLEFEPFETVSLTRKKSVTVRVEPLKCLATPKFLPISSSSRSNLRANNTSKKFNHPFVTSSRCSLLVNESQRLSIITAEKTLHESSCSLCCSQEKFGIKQENVCSSTLLLANQESRSYEAPYADFTGDCSFLSASSRSSTFSISSSSYSY